jgi:hypothetical protein
LGVERLAVCDFRAGNPSVGTLNHLLLVPLCGSDAKLWSGVPIPWQLRVNHAQQPEMAKLKADAQKVVSIISSDKAKTETFCELVNLGKAADEVIQEKDTDKLQELAARISEGEKQLGPEYVALVDALRGIDLKSQEAQEILSTFDPLDASCAH